MIVAPSPWWSSLVVLFGLASGAPPAAPAAAPQGAASLEAWRGDLAGARREAAERNVVLLVHVILEGEPENDAYRDDLLPHKRLLELSRNAVVIVANNGQHTQEIVQEKGEGGGTIERRRCRVYPMFESCAQHNGPWLDLYREFQEETGELLCPQTVIELPGGAQSWRHNVANPPTAAELIGALERAQKAAGPGLSPDQLRAVKSAAADGRAMQRARGWAQAWRHWQEVLALTTQGQYADEARAGQSACLAGLTAEIEEAAALLVPGSAARGYGRLVELAEGAKGLPLEKDLARRLREAERNPALKDEIARYKTEQEAEALLREGLEQLRAGDERRAQRTIQRLLRTPKYADPPAAKRAAEEFPAWVPE